MPYVETTIGDYQCGYRRERSTVDQIFTVLQILEKCCEHGKDTRHLFIDFDVAYDSINRCSLYAALEEINIPQELITLFRVKMKNTQCRVKIQNRLSEPINPLNPELNPICYLLALLGAHHFLHVSRIRVKSLTFRRLMSYIYTEHQFLMFLDHTQRRSTVGRTPLDE